MFKIHSKNYNAFFMPVKSIHNFLPVKEAQIIS